MMQVISYKENEKIELNNPNDEIILLKCIGCEITGVVKELWILESSLMIITALKTEHIRIKSYPPFYKLFNKLRRRKWRGINGSNYNSIVNCEITSENIGIKVDDNYCTIVGNIINGEKTGIVI